ncbi:MAG: VCBS repeat-containing protein, partial [Bacteroidota bacterium]
MKYFSFLAFLIVAQGLAAQTFTEVPPFKPLEAVGYSSVAFADVDGDEDQDVLVIGVEADGDRVSKLYLNNGQGVFNEGENTPFAAVDFGDIAFADVDGDGDQDVLITGAVSFGNPISKLYLNDGTGDFSEVTSTPFEAVESSSVAFSDVDSDGDQDVLIT